MDSFEINKIIAAVLLIALLTIGIAKISDLVFYVKKPDTPGYKVEAVSLFTKQMACRLLPLT